MLPNNVLILICAQPGLSSTAITPRVSFIFHFVPHHLSRCSFSFLFSHLFLSSSRFTLLALLRTPALWLGILPQSRFACPVPALAEWERHLCSRFQGEVCAHVTSSTYDTSSITKCTVRLSTPLNRIGYMRPHIWW